MQKNNQPIEGDDKIQKKIKVRNKLGLHARPAALLVQTVSKFEADISITKGSKKVNGKSIMGVMMLAAGPESVLNVEITGPDAHGMMEAVEDLFDRNFDE